ncbi:unnamed protein product [Didymodactylos carnosus]|uniref:Uncharacterized protein n=1 Tax=Didymodactylos carnosus TaxID=1234261 RepID=A0A813WR78_9BILA|nr:unnamed protein product [Didymodactylos carnosus]CAF0859166.1 unnamed protein product [Didymodactylos carnosus]CAF3606308.1 unnamed protein product [Didymodactylos carnosus]CAF3646797.1 unnamed protein product [Didymodactylos carnosus]
MTDCDPASAFLFNATCINDLCVRADFLYRGLREDNLNEYMEVEPFHTDLAILKLRTSMPRRNNLVPSLSRSAEKSKTKDNKNFYSNDTYNEGIDVTYEKFQKFIIQFIISLISYEQQIFWNKFNKKKQVKQ